MGEREREEETSQHPPFLFSKREAREREMGRQATGSRGQKAFLCSSSARGLGYPVALQSCHTRGRELNKFPEDVGSRGWRGEKAGEGRMSAGKNETRSSSGKVVPAKQKTSPSPSSSCSPRAQTSPGLARDAAMFCSRGGSLDDKFSFRVEGQGIVLGRGSAMRTNSDDFSNKHRRFAVGKNLDEWSDATTGSRKKSLSNSRSRYFFPLFGEYPLSCDRQKC